MAFLSNFPVSYKDPLYSQLAATTEQKLGLPTGILDAIRMNGERSNANQISSAGAATPYQFIPATRAGVIKNYGTDPYSDPASATDAAGELLRENYRRAGSWDKAIAMYYGGNNPGRAAQAYQARVGDFDNSSTGAPGMGILQDSLAALAQNGLPGVNQYSLGSEAPTAPNPAASTGGLSPSTPVTASAVSTPATPQSTPTKQGGILGALKSIFMPDPGSLWAGALRNGVFDARESQHKYQVDQMNQFLNMQLTNAKLQQFLTKGEFVPLGHGAALHVGQGVGPNGQGYEVIGNPAQPSSIDARAALIDKWKSLPPGDPTRPLYEAIIYGSGGANAPQALATKGATQANVAGIRAAGTVKAATIRGPSAAQMNQLPPLPPGARIVH